MLIYNSSNPYQSDLFVKKVLKPYRKDYLLATDYSRFMGGEGSGSLIEMKKNEGVGAGQIVKFPLHQIFPATINNGLEPLEGREAAPTVVSDEVKVDMFRFAVGTEAVHLQQLQVNQVLSDLLRTQLHEQSRLLNTKRITQAFGLAFPGAAYAVNTDFDYSRIQDRMLAAPLDQANLGISRSRIIIGNDVPTTFATMTAALLVANLPTNVNDHKLTVAHIRKAAIRAKTGKSALISDAAFRSKESPVRPMKTTNYMGYPDYRYALLIAPETYMALVDDEDWQAQTRRGVIEQESQPTVLYGSMYKGTIEGVMVIEIPEFSDLIITNGAGNRYAYSALCGAGALSYVVGKSPYFEPRSYTDFGLHTGISHNEISAFKALHYPSKSIGTPGNNANLVTHGIVHSFTVLS